MSVNLGSAAEAQGLWVFSEAEVSQVGKSLCGWRREVSMKVMVDELD